MTALFDLYNDHPAHYMRKFFIDQDQWLKIAGAIAHGLGLHRPPFGLRILDIGCGVGQFIRVCNDLGHSATGIDIPDVTIARAAELYGVSYRPHTIKAGEKLPADLCGYDLVTMFGVNLRRSDGTYWTWSEWEPFANDVLSRIVVGGRWVLRPNLGDGPDIVLDIERWHSILRGASVARTENQITITKE